MNLYKLKYILVLFLALLFNCKEEAKTEDATPVEKAYLVSATLTNEIALNDLKAIASLAGQNELTDKVKYGVKTYKIVYETTYKNSPIKASGLLYVPTGVTGKSPLLSLQHGTTFLKADAPSISREFYGMEYFASAGYISLLPDFIGYGESDEVFHPYYDQKHSAFAVIDMIKSSREFLKKEKIEFNDKLFLAGYSEGGYVTLAAAKEIEQNPQSGLKVTAVAAGAGGYDLEEMLKGLKTNNYYTYPSYFAFVLMSYNNTYDWNKPLNYFFNDKYAEALSKLMDGKNDGGYINSKLTTNLDSLFNGDFYRNLKTESGEPELKAALKNNSVSGWKSDVPMRLYHGTKDDIVPFKNSDTALEKFKAAGAKDVTLIPVNGGGHGSSFIPMVKSFVPWFEEFK